MRLKHPGELLAQTPATFYFNDQKVDGSTPAWDDPSYWSDGLRPRFVPSQTEATVKKNLLNAEAIVLRLQVVLLVGVLCYWGFTVWRASLKDPMLAITVLLALGCVGAYSLVLVEGRFVDFALVLIGALYAACALARHPPASMRSLHLTVLAMAALILFSGFRLSLLQWAQERQSVGARPFQGVYDMPSISAAEHLAARFPKGSQVACMGHRACYGDPYWVRYAGMHLTGVIESGQDKAPKTAAESCRSLEQNPDVLLLLKARGARAVVGRFKENHPCSAAWRPLESSGDFYYLPL